MNKLVKNLLCIIILQGAVEAVVPLVKQNKHINHAKCQRYDTA